jgi:hypothetical protein
MRRPKQLRWVRRTVALLGIAVVTAAGAFVAVEVFSYFFREGDYVVIGTSEQTAGDPGSNRCVTFWLDHDIIDVCITPDSSLGVTEECWRLVVPGAELPSCFREGLRGQ